MTTLFMCEPASIELMCPDEVSRLVTLNDGLISVDDVELYRYPQVNCAAEYLVSVLMQRPDQFIDRADPDFMQLRGSSMASYVDTFNRVVRRHVLYTPIQKLKNKNKILGFLMHSSSRATTEAGISVNFLDF